MQLHRAEMALLFAVEDDPPGYPNEHRHDHEGKKTEAHVIMLPPHHDGFNCPGTVRTQLSVVVSPRCGRFGIG